MRIGIGLGINRMRSQASGGGRATYVFFTESAGNTVRRIDAATGENNETIATLTGGNLRGISADRVNDKLYVGARALGTIVRMNLDGTGQENWKSGLTDPYAPFVFNGRIYWSDATDDTVKSDLPGGGDEQTHVTSDDGCTDPFGIFVTESHIWVAQGTATGNGEINRFDHDGENRTLYKNYSTADGIGVIVDEVNEFVYYAGGGPSPFRQPLATGAEETALEATSPQQMAIDGERIFATRFNTTTGEVYGYLIEDLPTTSKANADWIHAANSVRGITYW